MSDNCESGRGSLTLQKHGNRIYGYERWQHKGEPGRKVYLGPLESDAVRDLFSNKFQTQRMVHLRHDQKLLEKLEQQYRKYDFESIVSGLPGSYRTAASVGSFDERYEEVRRWANADYPKNDYPFPEAEIYAKDGTRLRSKGECVWYNLLLERGILFRYDSELEIIDSQGDSKILSPDFLIMCLDGTLIIVEHLGRIGSLSYAMRFGEKCYWYSMEGFILGKTFFVTSDDANYGTDSQMIEKNIDRIEEMFYGF